MLYKCPQGTILLKNRALVLKLIIYLANIEIKKYTQ
jgi:hypothetical protein